MDAINAIMCVVLLVVAGVAQSAITPKLSLVLLSNSSYPDAKCLDGSPGAFYLRTTPGSTSWMIYFEGGGWCYGEVDCLARSQTALGSSTGYTRFWPDYDMWWIAGPLSSNCTVNPTFCNFNLVYIKYCDGSSFSGTREEAVNVNGTSLYFRGKFIREGVIDYLAKNENLTASTHVLLTGCSAGGLAAFLHADSVHHWFTHNAPSLQAFGVLPISGFFLLHDSVNYRPVYESELRTNFNLSMSSKGLNQKCVNAFPPDEQWRCYFAEYSFTHTHEMIKFFVVNSKTDMWQVPCIFTISETNAELYMQSCMDAHQYRSCSENRTWPFPLQGCFNNDTIVPVLGFEHSFGDRLREVRGFLTEGNTYFINSCWTHCEAQSDTMWQTLTVNGVVLRDAVERWWKYISGGMKGGGEWKTGLGLQPSLAQQYDDCNWSHEPPFLCNPTCPQ